MTIGLDLDAPAGAEGAVRQVLRDAGVPMNALQFERSRITLAHGHAASGRAAPSSLQAPSDTLVGGTMIEWTNQGASGGLCTLGFPVEYANGTPGFITASHCSATTWGDDGTGDLYYQPRQSSNSTPIGYEAYDPPGGTCPLLWPCGTYRFSDANLNTVTGRPLRRGVLLRPAALHYGGAGTLSVDGSRPYLYVTATSDDIMSGQDVEKIGITTGWTYGGVNKTCYDYLGSFGPINQQMVRCVYRALAYTWDGDSGGPVFSSDGYDAATALGITMARDGTDLVFSKWQEVYSELSGGSVTSSFTVTIPAVTITTAPTLSGTVTTGGVPALSWAAVDVTNAPQPVVYRLIRSTWDASANRWLERDVLVTTTAGTSFIDSMVPISTYSVGASAPDDCVYSYVMYTVMAYDAGQSRVGNTVYYTGDSNGAGPNQCGGGPVPINP